MIAKDIMTKNVISISPDTSAYDAILLLVGKQISGAPVLESTGKLVGIVTELDLIISMDFVGEKNLRELPVSQIMTKETLTFSEDTLAEEISRTFIKKNIKRVPIVREDRVVGIVSRRDILRGFMKLSAKKEMT